MDDEVHRHDGEALPGERRERASRVSRRAVLRAGWVVPVILTVRVPPAFAAGSPAPHADSEDHQDVPEQHVDAPGTGTHVDVPGPPHVDSGASLGHQDVSYPHVDTPQHADT